MSMAPRRTRDNHGQAGVHREAADGCRMRSKRPCQGKAARVHCSGCAGLLW